MRKNSSEVKRLIIVVPLAIAVAYAIFSSPMMFPGFDVWIHLVGIEFDGRREDLWYQILSSVFTLFVITDPFTQAKLVHSVHIVLACFLVFWGARWFLLLADRDRSTSVTAINFLAWFAVLVWLLMHGTVSAPIGDPTQVWSSWTQWYSVNYQIALPFAIFSVGAFTYGLRPIDTSGSSQTSLILRLPYFLLSAFAAIGVAALHAAEVPYITFGIAMAGVLWYQRAWHRAYVALLVLVAIGIGVGLAFSYRLPEGVLILQREGLSALLRKIAEYGLAMTQGGLNRGNSSWNYWYWTNLLISLGILFVTLHPNTATKKHLDWRAPCFVAVSATLAAMLHFELTAGLLAMVTYPALAWRFSFSSFLFLAPPLLLMAIAKTYPKLSASLLTGLAIALIALVLGASRLFESNWVSYQYARSLAMSLSTNDMRFGLTPSQSKWLSEVHNRLTTTPPAEMVCTDMFTAYYLLFVKDYHNVVLPPRISNKVNRFRLQRDCDFPKDGGDIKSLGLGPVPWNFDLNSPPWWKL
jgi:hypothetical protein